MDPVAFLPIAPLMHAAGCWTVMMWLFAGGRIVLLPGSFDPLEVWRTVACERVNSITVVGDPVLRPLLDAWDALNPKPDISSLAMIGSGGALLSATTRQRALTTFPGLRLADGYGSSETGIQGAARFDDKTRSQPHFTFSPAEAVVLDEETLEPVAAGSSQVGQVARAGRIPLGYYNDAEKSARTFVTYGGCRWAISGDLATVEADGTITVLGRGSQCINTGRENVFPEEVEAALRAHPAVYDVLVVGAPDDRWAQRVVALVQATPGERASPDNLRALCRSCLAGYKVPKEVVLVDHVVRSPGARPTTDGRPSAPGSQAVATVRVSRPERNKVPGVAPVALPSANVSVPLTSTLTTPMESAVSRAAPPGRSRTRLAASEPMVAGSNTTRSACQPGSIRPRSFSRTAGPGHR
jgi:3-oxocholest-4-en-26-oate---CoA ligase